MNFNKILVFLILAFGLSWLSLYIPPLFLEPESIGAVLLQLLLYSWGPAAAAFITQKYIYNGSIAAFGWNRKRYSFSWITYTMLAPVLVVLGTLGTIFLLGNVFHIPGFGQVILEAETSSFMPKIAIASSVFDHHIISGSVFGQILQWLGQVQIPQEIWVILVIVLVVGVIAGASVNLLFNAGEEMGWRGFMLEETRSLGFLGSNTVIGILYGLWQIPFILYFVPELSTELFWIMITTVGFALSVSFPMAYFSVKTRSVYASATFIGVLNNIASVTLFFVIQGDLYISSVKGLAGMLALMLFTFLIIRFDEKFVERYKEFRY